MSEVELRGWAVIDLPSLGAFLETCSSMGEVLSLQDVALLPGSRRHVNGPAEIPLHSDGPQPDIVAWYCVRQDEFDGTSILLDTAPVLRTLTSEMLDVLASISIPYFNPANPGRPEGYMPVLIREGDGSCRINYTPWLLPTPLSEAQASAIASFQTALSKAHSVQIRLSANIGLFVDNRRVLHGRRSLASNSNRLLKRAWVRTRRRSPEDTISPSGQIPDF